MLECGLVMIIFSLQLIILKLHSPQAGYMCAQLAASQATSDGAERVLALGRLSMSYTIGSVLGPALGKSVLISFEDNA